MTAVMVELWGTGASLRFMGASHADDPQMMALWGRAERLSISPGGMRALYEMLLDIDVRAVLPSVRVPCLVIHAASSNSMFIDHARYLAEHLPDARLVALEGVDHYPWFANGDRIVAEVEEFLTGARHGSGGPAARHRSVHRHRRLHRARRRAGRSALARSRPEAPRAGRRQLERFRGREIDTAGDGIFACFDGPARAVSCACAIRDGVRASGSRSRAGVHTGEIECRGDAVAGLAVHIGAAYPRSRRRARCSYRAP